MTTLTRHARPLVAALVALTALASVLSSPAQAADTSAPLNPTALPSPFPAGLPGPVTPAFAISPSVVNLSVSPYQGPAGTRTVITATGLPDNATVTLAWSTSNVTWVVSPQPDTVNYLGRSATNLFVTLATATTSSTGALRVPLTIPVDFGGTHDIYAVVNGVAVAHGGFSLTRTLTVTPSSGPVGTPITITYSGLGATLYTGGAAVLWDNHYVGEMMANWTRGVATVTIRAAGAVGPHLVQVGDAISYLYMNIIQSPVPFANGAAAPFTITPGHANLSPRIDWPASPTPTINAVTTLSAAGAPTTDAVATLSRAHGPVGSSTTISVTGLPADGAYQLSWASVQGSRVNCPTSSCWAYIDSPLGSATATGGELTAPLTVPNGLGGWHVVQVLSGTTLIAQVPFYVTESLVPFRASDGRLLSLGLATATTSTSPAALADGQSGRGTTVFHQGQEITISLLGVGWTQLDNTLGVDYDNSYIGYGCGFNSNGYTVIHLRATGGPGVHLIDLYPMLYTQQPSFANTPYGMTPVLTYAHDFPGLALGYRVPSFHLAITIVK